MTDTKDKYIQPIYEDTFQQGISHVLSDLNSSKKYEEKFLQTVKKNEGNVEACMLQLSGLSLANSIVIWFCNHDLIEFKRWSYVSAKIERIRQQASIWQIVNSPLVHNLFSSWSWLASDYENLISWRTQFEPFMGWTGDQGRPKEISKDDYDLMFAGYQLTLALRKEWDRLGERSERWLANPPPKIKRIAPDMQFFLALAKGDVPGMEAAMLELVTPKQRKWRDNWHSGLTHRLFSEEAVVYGKLAWRNGYQVQVESPYVPMEWLPVKQLPEYVDPPEYEFMHGFDIHQPLSSAE